PSSLHQDEKRAERQQQAEPPPIASTNVVCQQKTGTDGLSPIQVMVGVKGSAESAEPLRTWFNLRAKTATGCDEAFWLAPGSGEVFRDLEHGPEMVVIPSGEFLMGSPNDEPERFEYETP